MPTPEGNITNDGLIYICGKGEGKAYGHICAFMNGSLSLNYYGTEGWVGNYINAKGHGYFPYDLGIKASVGFNYIKRVIRINPDHKGRIPFNISGRGNLIIRSVVSAIPTQEEIKIIHPPTKGKVLTPIKETKRLDILLSHHGEFIPEIGMPVFNASTLKNFESQRKITIQVLKEYISSDEFLNDRRNWLVGRILFEDQPIMYIVNVGYKGSTYPFRFVMDTYRYQYMLHYLFSLMKTDNEDERTSISGILNDRRRITPNKIEDIRYLPKIIQTLIHEYGDYDPVIRSSYPRSVYY